MSVLAAGHVWLYSSKRRISTVATYWRLTIISFFFFLYYRLPSCIYFNARSTKEIHLADYLTLYFLSSSIFHAWWAMSDLIASNWITTFRCFPLDFSNVIVTFSFIVFTLYFFQIFLARGSLLFYSLFYSSGDQFDLNSATDYAKRALTVFASSK